MQLMRYINLFGKISRVSTTDCFVYNNTIYFAVPRPLMMQAIGKAGINVKRISEVLRRKIKIISMPKKDVFEKEDNPSQRVEALKNFVQEIVSPIEFTNFEFKDGIVNISGTRESKAILIGRDRSREKELAEVLERTFGVKEFKII